MNWYEQKQEAKRERLIERAERKRKEGMARYNSGMERLRAIPFGQPILVGHYSENRDRNYRRKAIGAVDKGIDLNKEADRLEARAENVGNGGVSSDDPEAVTKLKEKLAGLEALQAKMTAANKIVRKFKADKAAGVAALVAAGYSEKVAAGLFEPDFAGRLGFPGYELTNNGANIRRIKERIEFLGRAQAKVGSTYKVENFTIIENTEINRLQFVFPGKPAQVVRDVMKRNGFRWSPTEGAWQRQLTGTCMWNIEQVVQGITGMQSVDAKDAIEKGRQS